ncbi:hypothetical protein [Corynebacterium tuberculostearicum]
MTDPQANLHAVWRAVVDDLLAQSEQPNSEVPSFRTHSAFTSNWFVPS